MKILQLLKLIIKYGSWIMVFIDILTYASEKIEAIYETENTKKDAKLSK